jgi:DNA-binding MarR family transcriptional regulator
MTSDLDLKTHESPPEAWPLEDRPGFLIRRMHQIHVSLFAEACAEFRVTPLQYSLLSALTSLTSADQTTLANLVALDRTTTTGALKRLESRGLIRRERSDADRRSHVSALTEEGRSLVSAMEASARHAHAQTLSILSDAEAALFVAMMKRIAAAHEDRSVAGPLAEI